jgi:hypothetical protein
LNEFVVEFNRGIAQGALREHSWLKTKFL